MTIVLQAQSVSAVSDIAKREGTATVGRRCSVARKLK